MLCGVSEQLKHINVVQFSLCQSDRFQQDVATMYQKRRSANSNWPEYRRLKISFVKFGLFLLWVSFCLFLMLLSALGWWGASRYHRLQVGGISSNYRDDLV